MRQHPQRPLEQQCVGGRQLEQHQGGSEVDPLSWLLRKSCEKACTAELLPHQDVALRVAITLRA
jgi:hypothetical protein